jgi:hypothetical protein
MIFIKIKKLVYILSIGGVLIFYFQCNAPRDNPLDPANPNYNISTIEGTIRTESYPNLSISGVNVFWENEGITVKTNNSGYFIIGNIRRNNGWLIFTSKKFNTDSVYVTWSKQEKISLNVVLNALPVLDSVQLYSILINSFQFTPESRLFVAAQVSDPDGENDIDSVFVTNSQISLRSQLLYNPASRFYERTFELLDLNVSSLDELIGENFKVAVRDLSGRQIIIGTENLKRVIKEEITPLSPINNDSINQPFTIKWKRLLPGFSFEYLLQVYTNESPPQLVWQEDGISSDSISTYVDQDFSSGEYFWVIWSVDTFLDRNRSKPSSFVIR